MISEIISKSLKTEGITLALDRSEDEMSISHNQLLNDDQVMVEKVEQSVDEQDEEKSAEIDDKNYNLEENDEEKETTNIEFIEQKADIDNDENVIGFRWLDVQGGYKEDITKTNFIMSLQKQTDAEISPKKFLEDCLIITVLIQKSRKIDEEDLFWNNFYDKIFFK